MPAKRQREPPESGYYTLKGLAVYLNQEESTLRYWRRQGVGPPGVRHGKSIRYAKTAVRAWEKEQEAAERARQGEVAQA